jgi:hypothetical protein
MPPTITPSPMEPPLLLRIDISVSHPTIYGSERHIAPKINSVKSNLNLKVRLRADDIGLRGIKFGSLDNFV